MTDKEYKSQVLFGEITHRIPNKYGCVDCVAAVIYGQKHLLREYQVRALQIKAKEIGQRSDEEWQEFVDNVVVYNTWAQDYCSDMFDAFPEDDDTPFEFLNSDYERDENVHVHKMIWKRDGRFENGFTDENGKPNGFYSRNSDMTFELFD